MYRKSYPFSLAQNALKQEEQAPFSAKWISIYALSSQLYIMVQHTFRGVIYTPLYIHRFPLLAPKKPLDAGRFEIAFSKPESCAATADKLRYYRYKKSLLQSEVAAYAGIDFHTYASYEEGRREYYPPDKLGKIAELLEVRAEDLLDDHNAFLLRGQGLQMLRLREGLGLTRPQFAARFDVHLWNVKQ